MSNKRQYDIEYDTIIKATQGDATSINAILNKYEPYINQLSAIEAIDKFGSTYSCVNEETKRLLQTKLIAAILKFDPVL